jgi:hypothetical protein
LHDGVAVPFAVGEGDQHVELCLGQREERGRIWFCHTVYLSLSDILSSDRASQRPGFSAATVGTMVVNRPGFRRRSEAREPSYAPKPVLAERSSGLAAEWDVVKSEHELCGPATDADSTTQRAAADVEPGRLHPQCRSTGYRTTSVIVHSVCREAAASAAMATRAAAPAGQLRGKDVGVDPEEVVGVVLLLDLTETSRVGAVRPAGASHTDQPTRTGKGARRVRSVNDGSRGSSAIAVDRVGGVGPWSSGD